MKKTRTLIMLLLVFILAAAFGKKAEANGVECNHKDALGNPTWEQVDVSMRPDCTTPAYYVIRCRICGKEETHITEPALGHNWGKWELAKAGDCISKGVEERVCKRCHKTETRSTKLGSHKWGAWQLWKPATCEEVGKEGRVCSVCKAFEMRDLKALGHKWSAWKVTKEPSHGTNGEEQRTCSTCKKTETRTIAGDKVLAKVGDSGIRVLIAQEILKENGDYSGACDGVFREDLAKAIKAYEKAQGLAETGAIYQDTLQLLSKTLWFLFGEGSPMGEFEYWFFEESGLDVKPLAKYQYTPQPGGFHEVLVTATGFKYIWENETEEVSFPDGGEYVLDTYCPYCEMDGDKPICKYCGQEVLYWLTESVKLNVDELLANLDPHFGIVLTILHPDELKSNGLPLIAGLSHIGYLNALEWDAFEGALNYDVYLWRVVKDGSDELIVEDSVDDAGVSVNSYALPMLNMGKYLAAVLAKDDNGALSDYTMLYFEVGDGTMPDPTDVILKNGVVSWQYDDTFADAVFHVTLLTLDEGEYEYYETDTENNWVDLTPVFMEMAVKVSHAPGIQVKVAARDANGELVDSKAVYSKSQAWQIPRFYRVLCAVNVRSGPGKNFERIGGYSLGDYFISYETEFGADGIFYAVNYKGQTGYVLSSCAAEFVPKLFSVHVDLGNGKGAEVFTNPDGTINQADLMDKVQKRGYYLAGLKQTAGEGKGSILNLYKALQPGDAFEAVWTEDPDYVFVRFCDDQGKPVNVYDTEGNATEDRVPIRIGTTFRIRMASGNTAVPGWRFWDGKSYSEVTDNTPFTDKMTTVFVYERKGLEITLGKTTVTGRPEALLYLYEHVNKAKEEDRGPRLQVGDVLTILGEDSWPIVGHMYRVHVDRLNKDGYICAELLDGLNAAESYNIYFNANGGYCPVGYMLAKVQKGYAYPTLKELPVPSRSGWYFAGWEDAKGNPVKAGYDFTKSMTLKAKWIEYTGGQTVKQGLTVSRGDKPFAEQTKPYGFETPTSKEKIELPVCEEVQVLGETADMYQCLRSDHSVVWVEKRFIATDYELNLINGDPFYWDFYWKEGNPDGSISDGKVGAVSYDGKQVLLMYVLQERNNWQKVAIPNAVTRDGKFIGSGVAWMPVHAGERIDYYCRVTFCPGEGVTWLDQTDVEYGQTIPASHFPVPCLSGYEFEGWYTDPVLGRWVDCTTPITESMTLYAHYKDLYGDVQAATEKAPIYDRPSTSKGNVLGYVDAGEAVIVQYESKKGLFAWVTHGSVSGWVQTRYLVAGSVMEAKCDYKIDRAIRSQAKYKKGTVYRNVEAAELFLHISSENGYYKVAYPCEEGYAYIAVNQLRDH